MRALSLASVVAALVAVSVWGCAGPYSGPPEKLRMPKPTKPPSPANAPATTGGPTPLGQPGVCKVDFDGKEIDPSARKGRKAKQLAQDAENRMAGADSAPLRERREMVLSALSTLADALKADPYSPQATYDMAVTYAVAGKKKCSLNMLERLTTLAGLPDNAAAVKKYQGLAKSNPAFEYFRKEADAALGQ